MWKLDYLLGSPGFLGSNLLKNVLIDHLEKLQCAICNLKFRCLVPADMHIFVQLVDTIFKRIETVRHSLYIH